MNNTSHSNEAELREALEGFETALTTPLIAGELSSWTRQVQDSWAQLVAVLELQVAGTHRDILKQIAREDLDLLRQVTQLAAEDREILRKINRLAREVAKLATLGKETDSSERKARENLDTLVQLGVDFVGQVRKQEVALSTWLTEAYGRDLGVSG